MKKTGYSIQMSFEVPDAEKRIAEKASESFSELVGLIRLSVRHLNIIYEPFNKVQIIDNDLLVKHRRVLRRYRKQIKDNFQKVIEKSNRCIILMGEFSTDTKTSEMMNSFIANLEDVKKAVNRLLQSFSDLDSNTFKDSLINAVDNVRKQANQLKQLINDRILDHIDTNILAKNWTSSVTDEYQNKVYEKLPMVVQLFQERQKALSG